MALTILHPKTALVVIDLQKGFAAPPTAHPVPAVISLLRLLDDGNSSGSA